MAQKSFSAAVSEWAAKTEQRMAAVFRQAAQTVANEVRVPKAAGGNMPVDTGNLRRSLMASMEAMPKVKEGEQTFSDNEGQIKLVIAGADLGQTVYLGFQANYARPQEYGTSKMAGNGFVRLTAQRWPQIVEEAAQTIQSRVEARNAR